METKRQAGYKPIVTLLFAVLTLLIFYDVIFRPGTIFGMDIVVQGYPISWYFSQVMASGARPEWFPYMMSGFPMISASPMYPLDWISISMPLSRAMTWRYIIHIFLGAVFMYLLMRRFNRSATGSIIGGMAFGFSAFFISKIYAGHGGAIWSGIWIPLTFLFLDMTIETRRMKYAALTGTIFGFQILGFHPQYAYYSGLAMALFVVWRVLPMMIRERKLSLAPVYAGLAILAFAFAFFISAPYILQFLQSTALSNRGGGTSYDFASSFSLVPAQFVTALAPSFWGNPVSQNSVFGALHWDGALFIGVIPFFLAVIAFIGIKDSRAGYLKGLAILTVLIAIGSYTPFFKLIYKIPGFNMIRAPSKILYLYTFAMAGLAAYGTDMVISSTRRLRTPRAAAIGPEAQDVYDQIGTAQRVMLFAFLGVSAELIAWLAGRSMILSHAERVINITRSDSEAALAKLDGLYAMQVSGLAWAAVLIALAAFFITAYMRKWISLRVTAVVIVTLSFVDLWLYADPLIYTVNARKLYVSGDRTAIRMIKADKERFRILPMDTDSFQYAQGVFDGLESVNGYYPVSIGRYANYVGAIEGTSGYTGVSADIKNHKSPLVGLLSVKYILSKEKLSGSHLTNIYSGRTHVYYNRNWKPRAFTVHNAKLAADPEDALERITEPSFDPRKTLILEDRNAMRQVSGSADNDRIRYLRSTDTEINISADMASGGYLFFSEIYYPAWKAWVDGKPAKIHQANYLFRAVYLPKGQHTVKMAYVNNAYRTGSYMTISSLVFIAGMLLVGFVRR